jgi:hypothetical protein
MMVHTSFDSMELQTAHAVYFYLCYFIRLQADCEVCVARLLCFHHRLLDANELLVYESVPGLSRLAAGCP